MPLEASSEGSGRTLTWEPTKPILSPGFASLSASAVRVSAQKEGVLVWRTASS